MDAAAQCDPWSCGTISNISFPFRLPNGPRNCGYPRVQLSCENNSTFIYLESVKYTVLGIDYDNHTIRIVDAAITTDFCFLLPNYTLPPSYFTRDSKLFDFLELNTMIAILSCPNPVNSDGLVPIPCPKSNSTGFRYFKVGDELNASDVVHMCTLQQLFIASKENSTSSLSDIRNGFQLSWARILCLNSAICDESYYFCCYRLQYWMIFAVDACGNSSSSLYSFGRLKDLRVRFHVPPDYWSRSDSCTSTTVYDIIWIALDAVALSLAIKILIGMPSILVFIIHKLGGRHLSMFEGIEGFLQSNNLTPIRYSYSDIKKMTRNFQQKLGEGGYGCVYKGKLRSGPNVAIKLLNKPKTNVQDFINEVATMGRIHHINVVKLVGYCVQGSKCALIYDFMPNGSLEKYIFSQEQENLLSTKSKYDVAIGVARGIEYLHLGCDIQILHFDIKPHNVLLDEDFTPKLSDFGLAKFYDLDKSMITLTAARGTIGYVAPELITRSIGNISHKADVYSYGMLLMELVGVKHNRVVDDKKSTQYFPYWVYDQLDGEIDIEIGCENKDDDGDEHECSITRKMTIVGLWCIQMNPNDRPSMKEVVKMLEGDNEDIKKPPHPSELSVDLHNNGHPWGEESSSTFSLWNYGAISSMVNCQHL